jgi:alkylhydroperoxidase family enzyme
MAWIKTIDASEWSGELAEIRSSIADPQSGKVDNILAIHSLDAGSLRAHFDLYLQSMKGTETLPKVDREMIAVIVSKENSCHY